MLDIRSNQFQCATASARIVHVPRYIGNNFAKELQAHMWIYTMCKPAYIVHCLSFPYNRLFML